MHALATPAPATELDELTLRRAQHGDERAWRDLIAIYQDRVHALIWRVLAGRAQHRAPDLTQETFVRVLRALPKFEPQGSAKPSTWILTIATRVALNELRRPDTSELAADAPAATERADATIERRRMGAAIAAAMATLDDEQRSVLVLREYHDLDYAEIAAALDLELGTVKSRLSRARAALRAQLVTALPELGDRA
ncbi:MAG: sigma-70 family RNA polymerase sigma factor [Kofleriaceae bacterium]